MDVRLWVEDGRLRYSAPPSVLTDELRATILEHRDELIRLLAAEAPAHVEDDGNRREFPMSFVQERMWFLDRLWTDDGGAARAVFNNPLALQLNGPLAMAALRAALGALVRRHAALRTSLSESDHGRVQTIQDSYEPAVRHFDLAASSEDERELECGRIIRDQVREPFDLTVGRLCRAALIRLAPDRHVLLLVLHHAASDGWSIEILSQELAALYAAFVDGAPSPLPPLPGTYGQHAVWQRRYVSGELAASQRRYWSDRLSGLPDVVSIPADRKRPREQSYRTDSVDFTLTPLETERLRSAAVEENATLFTALLAPFAILVARYSGQGDIAVGTPVANRVRTDAEHLVGCFVNTVVLRTAVSSSETGRALLRRVREVTVGAQAAWDLPFEEVVAALQPARTFSYSPLFQIMFALQFADLPEMVAGGIRWSSVDVATDLSPYDMSVSIRRTPSGLRGTFRYATDLFDRDRIQRMAGHYQHLLHEFPLRLDVPVGRLPLIGTVERTAIAAAGRGPSVEHDGDLLAAFEAHAKTRPSAVAVSCGSDALTYAELDRSSARMARAIQRAIPARGGTIAVALSRSVYLPAALVGVLRSGAAYVPLDPAYPPDRLRLMLEDSGAEMVVCDEALRPFWASFGKRVATIEAILADDSAIAGVNDAPVHPESLAYVAYTSGSAGRPKGVAVTRAALWNVLADMRTRLGVTDTDHMLALTSISFDISSLELFLPLLCGGRSVVVDRDTAADPLALAAAIDRYGCTVVQATPSTWRMLVESGWQRPPGLRILSGGEVLPPDLCRALLIGGGVWNVYGPTEATVWATAAWLTDAEDISLGRPIANTCAHVLDEHLEPVPAGIAGELFLGGAGVARGYFNRPDLTAERFVPDPMGTGGRLYRTGDLVRRDANGSLAFIGRLDQQHKIRGHRIELGEIEACLLEDPGVANAVVVPMEDDSGRPPGSLAAFVAPNAASRIALDFSLFYFAAGQLRREDDASTRNPYDFYLQSARTADEAGFHAVWTPERHFHEVGALYPNPSVLTAALATTTTRIQLRAGSVVLPLHDPIRVAEEWSVIDNLSGGRVGIAFASGWNEKDFVLFPERYAERREVMWRQIDVVRKLWRGEPVEITDGHGAPRTVHVFPRPVQAELPMWITAGGSPETFEAAGRAGASLLTHLLGQTLEELAERIERYRNALDRHGHGRRSGRVTVMLHTFVWDTTESAEAIAREPFREYLRGHLSLEQAGRGGRADTPTCGTLTADQQREILDAALERYLRTASLIGDVESCARMAGRLRGMGVDEVACLMDFGISDALVLRSLEHLRMLKDHCRHVVAVNPADLRARLRNRFPDYMLPAHITVLDHFPSTPNGKVDRRQLGRRATVVDAPVVPRAHGTLDGEVERHVAQIWQDLLQRTVTSPDDDFFRLGGHSLLAASFASRIRRDYGAAFPLKPLFEDARLRAVCQVIAGLPRTVDPADDPVRAERSRTPLSFQQERLWRMERDGSPAWARNKTHAWSIEGRLDVAALARAADALVARHESLRTRICVDPAGTPYQQVVPSLHPALDVSQAAADYDAGFVQRWAREHLARPFALDVPPCFRLNLFRVAEAEHVLVLARHAMVMDGWSLEVFGRELFALYGALGRVEAALANPPLQYADYCAWQRKLLCGGERDRLSRYWAAALAGASPLAPVTPDRAPPDRPSFAGASVSRDVPRAAADELRTMAADLGVTLFMLLLLAFKIAIGARTGARDLVIGTPVANRRRGELEGVLGFLANVVAVRTHLSSASTIASTARALRDVALEAFEHQELPIDQVEALLGWPDQAAGRILFVLHNQPAGPAQCGDLRIRELALPVTAVRYDLCLTVSETPDGFSAALEYNTDIYDERTAAALIEEWTGLMAWIVRHPEETVGRAEHAAAQAAAVYRGVATADGAELDTPLLPL